MIYKRISESEMLTEQIKENLEKSFPNVHMTFRIYLSFENEIQEFAAKSQKIVCIKFNN